MAPVAADQELRGTDIERIVTAAAPTRRPAELLLELVDDLAAAKEEWIELAAECGNVFSTWEWASVWWRHFGGPHRLVLVRCRRSDGATVALLPLCSRSVAGVRILRFIGYGPADQLGPLCRAHDRAATAHALTRALDSVCGPWDVFLGDHMAPAERWSGRLGATVLRRDASPIIRFQGRSWEEHMAGESRNLRGQAGRKERRLGRAHRVELRLTEHEDGVPAAFDTLVRLNAARWGSHSSAFSGARGRFHREFAALAARRGWCRLWILEADGRPVAAWYGLRFGGTESYYQSGRDPGWESWSVGFVLLVHTMREANRDGMSEYRLLLGDEAYKARFAIEDPGLETIGMARGPTGRAALGVARAWDALPAAGQRLLRRSTED